MSVEIGCYGIARWLLGCSALLCSCQGVSMMLLSCF